MTGRPHIAQMVENTRKRLFWPALLSAYGPMLAWIAAFGVLALVGVIDRMPSRMIAISAIVFHIGWVLLLIRGLRVWKRPTTQDARKLVDQLDESQPATTLIDRPIRPTSPAADLWAAHQARVRDQAAHLSSPSLFKQVQSADPLALRFVAPALVLAAGIHAGPSATQRLLAGIDPDFGAIVGADKLTAQAWVAPPGYTNRAPFILEDGARNAAPDGSELTIRVDARSAPTLIVVEGDDTTRRKLKKGEDGAYEARLTLEDSLTAELHLWGRRAHYELSSMGDTPPIVSFTEAPSRDDRDRAAFGWSVLDDYGVARLELPLSPTPRSGQPAEQTDSIPIDLPSVEPREAEGHAALDLTRHKWAGLEVDARLRAVDAAGQEGFSEVTTFTLPSRLFLKPLAKAAAEVRFEVLRESDDYGALTETLVEIADGEVVRKIEGSRLDVAPAGVRRASLMLDGLTWEPETYFDDMALYMGFRQAHAQLNSARSKADADRVDNLLWSVALRAEYGDYASAAEELERARQALERALRDGAPEDEVKRLMEAFRQAVQNYLKAQFAEAMRRGDVTSADQQPGGDSQSVGDDDLQRMLKAMEELAETGATEQARQLLADMTDMLERMQTFQMNPNGEGGEPMSGPMADALRELGEELLKQRELNDDTRRTQQQGEAGKDDIEDLADRQQALRDQQGAGLPGLGDPQSGQGEEEQDGANTGEGSPSGPGQENQPPEAQGDGNSTAEGEGDGVGGSQRYRNRMAEARAAQERAAQALRDGDLETAQQEQQRATQALGEAATDLAQTADQMNKIANGGDPESGERNQSDPLGRPNGNGDAGNGDDVHIPEQRERQRARDILNELRRRASERNLTDDELDYLQRLLDRF